MRTFDEKGVLVESTEPEDYVMTITVEDLIGLLATCPGDAVVSFFSNELGSLPINGFTMSKSRDEVVFTSSLEDEDNFHELADDDESLHARMREYHEVGTPPALPPAESSCALPEIDKEFNELICEVA